MTAPMDDDFDLAADERAIDALLHEHHGTATPPDLTSRVLAQRARGATAAAAVAEAARATEFAPPRRWLAVAAAALGVLAVLAALRWRTPTEGAPITAPQDPEVRRAVPVESIEQLRELLPQVSGGRFLAFRLAGCGDDLDEVPVQFTAEELALATTFADVALVEPAGAKWTNRLELQLPGNRHLALGIALQIPFGAQRAEWLAARERTGTPVRLSMHDLRGDVEVRGPGAQHLVAMLEAAEHSVRIAHGIARDRHELESLPVASDEVRLCGAIGSDDLPRLDRFTGLRRLDLAGLRSTLKPIDLTTIARLEPVAETLRELRLDGCALADIDLVAIMRLVHLNRLEVRGVLGRADDKSGEFVPFTGEGIVHYVRSSRMRDGPWAIDLDGCTNLTDDGLLAIAQWSPKELHLAGCGDKITATGWQSLMTHRHLVHLDLSRWSLDAARLADLAARTAIDTLVLRDCNLDDTALVTLQTTRSPLQRLDLTGNTAISAASLATLKERLPQTTIAH